MSSSYWRMSFIWIIKANLVVWAINAIIFAILFFAGLRWATPGFFSKITLVETGISFLIGGALAFSGSALPSKEKSQVLRSRDDWSIDKLRSSEKRANKYLILAVIFFLECLLVSFLGA